MGTFFHFLILILVFSSYELLPGLVSVEARKLNSNKVFTVDFIHHDSLLSPRYNSSMTPQESKWQRVLSSISRRYCHIRRSLSNTHDSEVVVTPSEGEYLMKIGIGTPLVEFTAIADTGSDLTWLQCSPCRICVPQPTPLFDPTKSSTYQSIACNSQSCKYPELFTGCHINDTTMNGPCLYFQDYVDGPNSTGFLSTETITFPLADTMDASLTFPSFVFGCGYLQFGSLFNGQGTIGLGPGSASLISQLGQDINHKFSYCLIPDNSEATSKIKFGANVIGPNVVSTPFLVKDPPGYYLTLDGISIGDGLIQVGQDVIIDSGTTLTWLEMNVYNVVRDALKSAIALSPVPDPEGMLELCYEAEQALNMNPPDVVFHFQGAGVVLKAVNVFWEFGNVTCLAMMPTETDNHSFFGNIAQVNFEVGYDLQAKLVSFAPTDCTAY